MDNFIFSKIMWLVRWGWVCSKREYIYISCLGSLSECSLLTCFCFLCSHQCLQRINRKGFKIKEKQRKRRDHMKRAEKWNCRSERQRAERVEKWRPASIFSVSLSLSHFSLFHLSLPMLSFSFFVHRTLSTCFSAFIFSLSLLNCIFSHFSAFYPSPIYILSLPLLFFCPPQPLNTHISLSSDGMRSADAVG